MNRFQSRLYFVIYVFIDCVCSCPKRKSFVPKQFSVVENTTSSCLRRGHRGLGHMWRKPLLSEGINCRHLLTTVLRQGR
jgi:hypothetical protein